jgi:sirohydrochlorin cobaltochelatase
MIREKLASRGERIDSPAAALAAMRENGFTHVAVQSLHTIAGHEYHDLLSVVEGFRSMHGPLRNIDVGRPLLAGPESLRAVRRALLQNVPQEREKDEAVVFMGHGTHHPANAFYQAMAYLLQQEDPLAFMGTVQGSPSLQDIVAELKTRDVDTVYLLPFMSVAGDHARHDMAGEDEGSWKSVLELEGFEVRTVLKGTAEFDNIVSVWVEHLEAAMARGPAR